MMPTIEAGRRSRRRGATLIELLISTGVFSFIAIALFALMRDGTRNWQAVEARSNVQTQLRTFERDITEELQKCQLSSVRIYGYNTGESYQHAIVFKSAMNETDNASRLGAPILFQLGAEIPVPQIHWQRFVLYYINRPTDAQHMADYGFTCATSATSPNPDNICPHKWLIRKDISLSANLTQAADFTDASKNGGVGPLIESGGVDSSLLMFPPPGQPAPVGNVWRLKVLARDILAFNLGVSDAAGTSVGVDASGAPKSGGTVIHYDIKTVKLMEAASMLRIGNSDLSQSQYTIQLDNAATPVN